MHRCIAMLKRHYFWPFPSVSLLLPPLIGLKVMHKYSPVIPFRGSQLPNFFCQPKKFILQRIERISPFSEPVCHVRSMVLSAVSFPGHSGVSRFRPLSQNNAKTPLGFSNTCTLLADVCMQFQCDFGCHRLFWNFLTRCIFDACSATLNSFTLQQFHKKDMSQSI